MASFKIHLQAFHADERATKDLNDKNSSQTTFHQNHCQQHHTMQPTGLPVWQIR